MAAAGRAAIVDRHREPREIVEFRRHAGAGARERQDGIAEVRAVLALVRAQENPERRGAGRHRAAAEERVVQRDADLAEQ